MARAAEELSTRHIHAGYQKQYSEKIDIKLFRNVLEEFNRRMMQVVHDGHMAHLPFKMGQVYIEKRKLNFEHLKLDYGHWRKTGEKLFHTNRHSDGFQAYYHWRKDYMTIPHNKIYEWVPTRGHSRKLAQLLFQPGGHKAYLEYIPKQKPYVEPPVTL